MIELYLLLSLCQDEPNGEETLEQDGDGDSDHSDGDIQLNEGGKKDSLKRRQELLVNSGLAEVCTLCCCYILEEYDVLYVSLATSFSLQITMIHFSHLTIY